MRWNYVPEPDVCLDQAAIREIQRLENREDDLVRQLGNLRELLCQEKLQADHSECVRGAQLARLRGRAAGTHDECFSAEDYAALSTLHSEAEEQLKHALSEADRQLRETQNALRGTLDDAGTIDRMYQRAEQAEKRVAELEEARDRQGVTNKNLSIENEKISASYKRVLNERDELLRLIQRNLADATGTLKHLNLKAERGSGGWQ